MLTVVLLTVVGMPSCLSDMDQEGKKTTGHKEYELTVASVKLPGVLTSSGSNLLAEVFAVKRDEKAGWEAMGSISGFEYEVGSEYRIRISETSYFDERMGDPAWTEYKLMEVISKERKDSEGLPLNFIPAWYFEECVYIDPDFVYAVEADETDEIENDLENNNSYSFEDYRYYLCSSCSGERWFKLDSDMDTNEQGVVVLTSKDSSYFPASYHLVMPQDYQMVESGQLDFITESSLIEPVMSYDVLISKQFPTKSNDGEKYKLWLFKDLTAYYQSKFPEANVSAVAIRYTMKGESKYNDTLSGSMKHI